jgi:hypothetical protein
MGFSLPIIHPTMRHQPFIKMLKGDQVDWRVPKEQPNPSLAKVVQKILPQKENPQDHPPNPPANSAAQV